MCDRPELLSHCCWHCTGTGAGRWREGLGRKFYYNYAVTSTCSSGVRCSKIDRLKCHNNTLVNP